MHLFQILKLVGLGFGKKKKKTMMSKSSNNSEEIFSWEMEYIIIKNII